MPNPLTALRACLQLLLPARCSACATVLEAEAAFCALCSVSLLRHPGGGCLRCGCPGPGQLCGACRGRLPAFSQVRAPFLYGGQLAVALHRFKYGGAAFLARPLGSLLRSSLQAGPSGPVIPVPLHPRRLRERGFNQAALLAREALGWSGRHRLAPRLLRRVRPTLPQAGLSAHQRLQNLRGAFRAEPAVRGQEVLLVDDALTTGATAEASAEALLEAGALSVQVLVLARVAEPLTDAAPLP